MNKNTDAKLAANRRYNQKTYKNLTISIKHEEYEIIKNYVANNNMSLAGYITELVKNDLKSKGISI